MTPKTIKCVDQEKQDTFSCKHGTVPSLPGETPDTEAGAEPGPAVGFFSAPTPEVHGLSMDH